jgi:hypothetical protein
MYLLGGLYSATESGSCCSEKPNVCPCQESNSWYLARPASWLYCAINTIKHYVTAFIASVWRERNRCLNADLVLYHNFVRPSWSHITYTEFLFYIFFIYVRAAFYWDTRNGINLCLMTTCVNFSLQCTTLTDRDNGTGLVNTLRWRMDELLVNINCYYDDRWCALYADSKHTCGNVRAVCGPRRGVGCAIKP